MPTIYFNAGSVDLDALALRITDLMFGRGRHLSEEDLQHSAQRLLESLRSDRADSGRSLPDDEVIAERLAQVIHRDPQCFSHERGRWQIGAGNNWFLTCVDFEHKDMRLRYRYDSSSPHIIARLEALRTTFLHFCGLEDANTCAEKLSLITRVTPDFRFCRDGWPKGTNLREDTDGRFVEYIASPLMISDFLGGQLVPAGPLRDRPDRRPVTYRVRGRIHNSPSRYLQHIPE